MLKVARLEPTDLPVQKDQNKNMGNVPGYEELKIGRKSRMFGRELESSEREEKMKGRLQEVWHSNGFCSTLKSINSVRTAHSRVHGDVFHGYQSITCRLNAKSRTVAKIF